MGVLQIKDISLKIAVKVAEEAYKDGMASVFPEPEVNSKESGSDSAEKKLILIMSQIFIFFVFETS